jgi:hypothetical protein
MAEQAAVIRSPWPGVRLIREPGADVDNSRLSGVELGIIDGPAEL